MDSLKLSTILLSLLSLAIITQAQDPTYQSHYCPDTNTFTGNSTYQANLNLLLSSLSSNSTRNNINGFYNVSAGKDPDEVYGMFLCRGDVSNSVCRNCVSFATKDVLEKCPNETVAMIWYDECVLRYSNRNIFSTVDQDATVLLSSANNVTAQPESFNQLVETTIYDIAARAASAPPGAKKFAVQQVNYTGVQKLYTLVQCTPDLSTPDCRRCLEGAISKLGNCCDRKQGGRVLFASCNLRYELSEFYNATAAAEAAPPPTPVALSPPPASGSKTSGKGKGGVSTGLIIAIVIPVAVSLVLFFLGFCFLSRRAKNNRYYAQENDDGNEITNVESLQFVLSSIEDATNHFSADNKLGEGGFGEVYKGTLPNGQAIAVKRLSKGSGQGEAEFKNEVILVAKLQHRNLVRLLGFCLEGEEKILVYEYVPNKSLDYFLFDPEKQGLLDWSKRYKIIGGIARGVLYLHEDSRLRVIHRDLKASNILLDGDMNAKVSDFGMARIFGVDQTQGSTNRIVGTYGYMSPEYAMHGQFSVKSDIYSFGVLVLEIISGKKNSSFYQTGGAADLASYVIETFDPSDVFHVWRHWRDGTPLEVMDPTLTDTYARSEVIRCIHIGLLCVQEDPACRPTMEAVVLMLNSYSITLALPREPAFFLHSRTDQGSIPCKEFLADQSKSNSVPYSGDEGSITEVYPR